jgi:hypothetical protein
MVRLSIWRPFVRRVSSDKEYVGLGVKVKVQNTSSEKPNAIVGVMLITALGFAVGFPGLDGMGLQWCRLFDLTPWTALEILRSMILVCCQTVPACLCHDQALLEDILHGLASHWLLLCVLAAGA